MNFDPETHLDTTRRIVLLHERESKSAADVTLSRTFDTNIQDLWDAVTNPDRIPRWATNVTGDLKLNGRYQIEGNASGTITECEPHSHIALTWEIFGYTSWVEFRFARKSPHSSHLTLTHTFHLSPHWDTYGPGETGVGWELALLGLALHTKFPDEPKPDEMELVTSPQGIEFITGSSNAWAQAAIESGTDPQKAQSAADQTTAFYTGQSVS